MIRSSEHPGERPSEADAVVSELWGRKAREMGETDAWQRRYWQSHPTTLRHINRLMTGSEDETWLAFTKRRFVPEPGDRGLSVGCGHGWAERDAIRLDLCRTMDGFDLSDEALEVARDEAAAAGLADRITYRQADLNVVELEPDSYDVAIAAQVLHHVDHLEHLLDQLRRSLRAGGVFVVQEYVGPARFQWLEKTQTLMNRMLATLPTAYRVNPFDGAVKEQLQRASAEDISAADPSESIRSDEIVALLESRFEVLYRADFGGTLLQFVLADIVANFDENDPTDTALLDLMSLFEEVLIFERVLPSDFAFFVLSARR